MRVLAGTVVFVASLLPAVLGTSSYNECHYRCPVDGYPVCGTDGNTYPSLCYLECTSNQHVENGQAAVSVEVDGRCPEPPCVCTTVNDPVCGSNGWTYPNECQLGCDSLRRQRYNLPAIYVWSKGECPINCVCPYYVQPVCGTDGRNYNNPCELACASKWQQNIGRAPIYIASYGPCPPPSCNCPLFIASVCGSDDRSYRNICFLECASQIAQSNGQSRIITKSYGQCVQENCGCPTNSDPVCASNGYTYVNDCYVRCENGRQFAIGLPPLSILYKGDCKSCVCNKISDPVCGSDGKTYGNPCELGCENERRAHLNLPPLTYTKGECGCFCPQQIYAPVCASDFRTYSNLCLLGCENQRRSAASLPPLYVLRNGECGCNCSDLNSPVCGSDQRTYTNVCWFNCNNFFLIRNGLPAITIVKNGPC